MPVTLECLTVPNLMDRQWSEIAANSLRIIMIDHNAFLFVHQTALVSRHSLLVNEVTGTSKCIS